MTFEEKDSGISFSVLLTTRASKAMISGIHGDSIRIKVSSPPVGNKANIECIELLANVFSTAKKAVRIIKGHRSRRKKIHIAGFTASRAKQIIDEHII